MLTPYKILFKFPSRSRPEKFFKGLDNILGNLADHTNYEIQCTLDYDDPTMYNQEVLIRLKHYMDNHKVQAIYGTSTCKVHAVNRDMERFTDFDIVVVYSDDMEFTKPGFDNTIREKFDLHFPDTNGCLHFYDGFQDRVCTMSIIGRMYLSKIGTIYHPSYFSVYCDEEFTEVARKLIKMAYYPDVIFMHKHPANGHGQKDALLEYTESFHEVDKQNFVSRRLRNYDMW